MVFSKLQPEPTFSPATTDFIASLSNNGKIKAGDIYAAAIHQLVHKVPEAISHKEFDAFVELSTKQDCTTDTQAHDLLKATQADGKYEGAFHKFFMCLDALFGPLRLFKGALDILCQCEPIFCAVWGAMKGLIQIAKEVSQVPVIINQGLETLLGFFPVYEKYCAFLDDSSKDDHPLRPPLVAIYVEFLTFCILARKVAKSNIKSTIYYITQDDSPFKDCLRTVEKEAQHVRDVTSALTLKGVYGTRICCCVTAFPPVLIYSGAPLPTAPAHCTCSPAPAHCTCTCTCPRLSRDPARFPAFFPPAFPHPLPSTPQRKPQAMHPPEYISIDKSLWKGINDTVQEILAMMVAQKESPSGSLSSTSTARPYHMVPGLLSSRFIGRGTELAWLEDTLGPENEKFVGGLAGIHGMTGIGKTQLMLKFEAKHRKCYTTHIFLIASSRAKFLASVQEVLEMLDLPQRHKEDPKLKILGLHNWLSQSSHWLLLIDNVGSESVELIQRLLTAEHGHVILTSQLRGALEKITGSSKSCHSLDELSLDEAVDMFINAADIDSDEANREVGTNVVNAMGLMPHAIEQAAAYIKVNGISPGVYLARYKQGPKNILMWDDGSETEVDEDEEDRTRRFSIGKHLWLTFDSLEQSHPDALIVLKFYSLLEPESIPLFDEWHRADGTPGFPEKETSRPRSEKKALARALKLFACCFGDNDQESSNTDLSVNEKTSEHPSDRLSDIFRDQARRDRAVAKLCDLSLVRRLPGQRILWMHDLTQKMARATILPEDLAKWVTAGINVVYHLMPTDDSTAEERAWVDICLPEAVELIRQAQSLKFETRQYACFLALCALCNLSRSWALSRKQFETVKPLYEQYLGLEQPKTATLLHELAWATRHDGDMGVSEKYFNQAWKIRVNTLGPNALETLEALNDLASTIERAGRLKEAEVMFEKLYNQHRESSGPEGPGTIAAAHNFAVCLHNQGRLAEAEKMYRIASDASQKYLGPEDQGTLKTLSNFAATLDHDGRYEEAKAIYDQALTSFVKVMGIDHHLTLRLRGNMADLLRQQGHFGQAETVMNGCLETVTRLFGSESFETITDMYGMGEVWQAKGDLEKARAVFEKIMGQLSGDMMQHPVVFRFIDSWGAVERELGHLDIAREKSLEAYTKFEALLGWDDPYTLMAANDHAEVLQAEGKYQEAWDLFIRCRDSFEKLLSKEHPHSAMVNNNLGRLCWALGAEDPMTYFAEAREIYVNRVGESHYCTLTVDLNIARTKFAAGDFEGATAMVAETKAALKSSIDANHILVSACDTILGMMFASVGDEASLVTAQGHLRASVETAKKGAYTANANFFLSVCLLIYVSRELHNDLSVIDPLLAVVKEPRWKQLSPLDIPGLGKFHVEQFSVMQPGSFDFKAHIPLATGETTRLRWGRKTCWRTVEATKLHE